MKPKNDSRENVMAFLAANQTTEPSASAVEPPVIAESAANVPAPPPVQERIVTGRATFIFPASYLDRLDALQRRWKGERRRITKDQMMTTALGEYLDRYEGL